MGVCIEIPSSTVGPVCFLVLGYLMDWYRPNNSLHNGRFHSRRIDFRWIVINAFCLLFWVNLWCLFSIMVVNALWNVGNVVEHPSFLFVKCESAGLQECRARQLFVLRWECDGAIGRLLTRCVLVLLVWWTVDRLLLKFAYTSVSIESWCLETVATQRIVRWAIFCLCRIFLIRTFVSTSLARLLITQIRVRIWV